MRSACSIAATVVVEDEVDVGLDDGAVATVVVVDRASGGASSVNDANSTQTPNSTAGYFMSLRRRSDVASSRPIYRHLLI